MSTIILLLLSAFRFSQGCPQRIIILQIFQSSKSVSFAPTSSISSLTTSKNLLFGLPIFLFPGNSISIIFLHTYSWSSSSSSFEGYPLQVRHKQDWDEGLFFYYPRLLHCLDQMLAVMSLSQHRVSSSKTVRPRAPCGARCIGHAVGTWSAICSEAPHSQFGEGARPHLCMNEWNRPTSVRRRLNLTQDARGKPIPIGLAPVSGTKARSLEAYSQYSVFYL